MTCFIWVVLVHVVLFQGIPEIAFVAEKELKPHINKETNKSKKDLKHGSDDKRVTAF